MGTSSIIHIPIGSLANYKAEQLYDLLNQAKEELSRAQITKEWLESAIALKYSEQIRTKRLRLEKDSGVVHIEDGDYKLTSNVAKKVEWDQAALAKIASHIALGGKNIDDYLKIYYKVSEKSYNSWSDGVRKLFQPARTIRLSNPSYELVKLDTAGGYYE